MEKLIVGDVVVVGFPFSDLSQQKLRPAVILAVVEFENVILAQITSRSYSSRQAIAITNTDFSVGTLPVKSYVRPDKLFTADPTIIRRRAGRLNQAARNKILTQVRHIFTEQ